MTRGTALLACALALAAAGGAAAARPFGLEKAGWILVTASEDTFVYMRAAASADPGLRRVWTAYDSDQVRDRHGFSFRSVQSLAEFDCRRGVSRIVEETFHGRAGLKGRTWRMPGFIPTPWAAPAPDSIGAIRLAYACRALSET